MLSKKIFVFAASGAVRLTKDHKPNDPDEKREIEAKGGVVVNGRQE